MYLYRLVARWPRTSTTSRVLGHEAFADLVREYLLVHPSRSPDIMQVGRLFGSWLRTCEGFRADLADLAMLERARSEVRTALDAPVAGAEALQGLPAEALPAARFIFAPSLRVLRLQHDVRPIWDALEEAGEVPAPLPGPTTLAVWRQAYKVFHTGLSMPEARALMVAREGGTLEDVCATFAGEPDPAHAAFKTVLSWFADGWVATVTAQRA
jgi:hypothetical protein